MRIRQIFGIFFTLLGAAILLFSVYVMLNESASVFQIEVSGFQAVVTGILGLIFFSTGVKFIR